MAYWMAYHSASQMATITETKARNIKPTDPAIPHGGITGLALHPSNAKGHGKWVLRYVSPVSGKRRNAGLGSYPEIGIAEVGKRATAMRIELAEGKDPLEEKAKIEDKPKAPTFKEAAQTWRSSSWLEEPQAWPAMEQHPAGVRLPKAGEQTFA